ncbi:MAG: hypothetical protein ACK4RN_15625 [Pseudorhodobacter sp.]
MTFDEQLKIIKASRQFHPRWYAGTYPEAAAQGVDPAVHYLREGALKGHNPGKFFDTAFYVARYPDVGESGLNPLVHYERIGLAENRIANPSRAVAVERRQKTQDIRHAAAVARGAGPGEPAAVATRGPEQAIQGRAAAGLRAAVAGIDFSKRRNFLLFSSIHATGDDQIAHFAPLAGALCRLIADLGLTWEGIPEQNGTGQNGANQNGPSQNGVVVVLTSANRDPGLIALARQENPQAEILLCAPGRPAVPEPAPGALAPAPAPAPALSMTDALARATRAYTCDAQSGMDALIRGVPLTVTGDVFYAGWGFTDDRTALDGRNRRLDFAGFLAILVFLHGPPPERDAPVSQVLAAPLRRILAACRESQQRRALPVPVLGGLLAANAAKAAVLKAKETKAAAAKAAAGSPARKAHQAAKKICTDHREAVQRLNQSAVAACRAGTWPAFLTSRVTVHLTRDTRAAMIDTLCATNALAGCRTPPLRRVLAALLLGLAGPGDRLDAVLPGITAALEASGETSGGGASGRAEAARLVADLARLSGLPPVVLTAQWRHLAADLPSDPGEDDVTFAVMRLLQTPGAKPVDTLLDWARRCHLAGERGLAERFVLWTLLTGRCETTALEVLLDSLWQAFDVEAGTELLDLIARCWPGGTAHARLALAAAARGDEASALDALFRIRGKAILDATGAAPVRALLARRYPGLPIADVLTLDRLANKANALPRAQYLTTTGRAEEALRLLPEAPPAAGSAGEVPHLLATSTALARSGQIDKAVGLVLDRLDKTPDPAVLSQAVALIGLAGDAGLARDLATRLRREAITLDPRSDRLLHQARGDLGGALRGWQGHPAAGLAARHLGARLVRDLLGFVEGSGKTLLVVLVDVPGGDLAWAGLFRRLAGFCGQHRLRIACDPGLAALLAGAFPQIEFVPSARQDGPLPVTATPGRLPAADLLALVDAAGWDAAEAADRVALITDLAADLAADLAGGPEAFDASPALLPDPARVARWQARLADLPRPLIGLSWRAGRGGALDQAGDLTAQDVIRLVGRKGVGFINLQGAEAMADLQQIEAACPDRILRPVLLSAGPGNGPAPDPATDPAEMLALMACLDAVIALDPEVRALAGSGGCRVWYPALWPSNPDWGRFTPMETDYRFATATYVDAPEPGDRAGLVGRLGRAIDELARDDLDSGLDRIETLLATEATGSEALNYEFRRAIADAEDEILTGRIHRSARYWEIRARLVEKLGVRGEAALCWGQACAQTRQPAPSYLRAHWIAQVWAGRPDLADRFGPVDRAGLPADALDHVTELNNDRIANDLSDEGLHRLAEGRRGAAADLFRRAVRASWTKPEHGPQLEAVVARLAGLDVFANPPAARREIAMKIRSVPDLHSYIRHASTLPAATHRGKADLEPGQPRSVFCSGYIYSGSGAVVDFLRQSPVVTVPGYVDGDIQPFDTELNILRRFYGLQHLLDLPPGQLSIEHLGEFLLGSVLGLIAFPSDRYRLDLSRKRSLRGAFEATGRMPELIGLCDLLLDTVEAGAGPDSEIILDAACRLVNGLAPRLARPGQPVVLWNNCIQAWNARTMAVMQRAVMVAVQRDPRDQYASQFYERGDKDRKNELESFISRTHHHQRMRAQLDLVPGLRARLLDVRFEDVVTDAETRARILEFAAIPDEGFREGLYFQPGESLRNIGIHRAFPDQAAIRQIEREFPDLLWQG